MNFLLHTAKRLTRLTCWVVLVSFLGSLAAPALHASKATVESSTETAADSSTETSASEASDSSASEVASSADSTSAASVDHLYYQTPKTDTTDLKRTVGTLVGGLMLGVLGLSFGWIGLAVGGALGAGLGYLISKEVFPSRASQDVGDNTLSDVYYDSRYGTGSNYPVQGYTAPAGTNVYELEQAYFDALTEYRQALRGSDRTRTNDARLAYQDAYEALIRAKAAVNQGY